jgi:hypothetical protein
VEGEAQVAGAEGARDPAGLGAGPEDAGVVAGPDAFAWCPGLGATLWAAPCDFVFDRIAAGIDAVAAVIGVSADGVPPDGLAAATCLAEPFKLTGPVLAVGWAAQAVAPRAAAKTAAAPATVAILRLRPPPALSLPSRSLETVGVLIRLLEWPGGSQEYPHNRTHSRCIH